MIVDTSALVAVLRDEPEAGRFRESLAEADELQMSAGTYLETAIVVDSNRDPVLSARLDEFIAAAAITVAPVTVRQVEIARQAYRDFGRGSGHAAALNFGDCFAYALARDTGQRLLYKGSDFAHAGLEPVIEPGSSR